MACAPDHESQITDCFVLNLFSNGALLLTNAPANGAQKKSCFGVEFIFKWRLPSAECPSPLALRAGAVLV